VGFLSICCITLLLFRKRIASAIIAIAAAGGLIYLDTLRMWSPKFIIPLPQSWFSDFRTHLIVNGIVYIGLSVSLYLIANKYLDRMSYRQSTRLLSN